MALAHTTPAITPHEAATMVHKSFMPLGPCMKDSAPGDKRDTTHVVSLKSCTHGTPLCVNGKSLYMSLDVTPHATMRIFDLSHAKFHGHSTIGRRSIVRFWAISARNWGTLNRVATRIFRSAFGPYTHEAL
jgi:hypothetical protein